MSEREGLLAAIVEAPEDDTPRLILADWLDERDDPLGEFIRLQIALEPLRRPCADPAAELERVKRLHGIPPGQDHRDDGWLVAQQLDRESTLLHQYRSEWLGEAAELANDSHTHFAPEFRRGLVASAGIGLTALLEHGEKVRRGCPALQELIVYGTRGRGKEMAACAALAGVPALLAGWLDSEDAAALAGSPHLEQLRSLTVWIGQGDDLAVCRALAAVPGLRRLMFVQMWGGIHADSPEAQDRDVDEMAALARFLRPDWEVVLERPFARRFPLDGIHIGRGIDGGHLPDGQAVLIEESKQPVVMYFDDKGLFVYEERLDLREKLVKPPKWIREDCDKEELIEVLGREIGFLPGPIFVREFYSKLSEVGLVCYWSHDEEMYTRAATAPGVAEDNDAHLYRRWSTGQFELPFGNSYGIDGLGRVHSS